MSGHASDWIGHEIDGRYVVEREIGAGGMGSVYVADDRRLGRRVVIKVPHAQFLAEDGFRERFETEIRSLTRLSHPNVVRSLDCGVRGGVPFAVIEFLSGGSLKDRLARLGGRMPAPDVAAWLDRIASALDFIHRQGVLHRDVKPANILFDARGAAYLADFGIVKALGATGTGLTKTGSTPGSPDYMAPEVVLSPTIGPAYDLYGLAVVVFHALTGRLPHEGVGGVAALARRAYQEPLELVALAPDVPAKAASAVMRALSRDPSGRQKTCAEFAAAFRAGLEAGHDAGHDGRHDAGHDAGLDAGGGHAAAGPVWEIGVDEVRRARPRRRGVGWLAAAAVAVAALGGGAYVVLSRPAPTPGAPAAAAAGPGRADAPPEAAVRDALATVNEALARADWEAVRRALSSPALASVPSRDLAAARRGLAVFDAEPVLEVEAPPDGFRTSARTVEVRGRARSGRATDRVFVGEVEARRTGEAFVATVALGDADEVSLVVAVRDGALERARRVVVGRYEAPWRDALGRATQAALRGDWGAATRARDEALAAGAGDADVPELVRSGAARFATPAVLRVERPAAGARLEPGPVVVAGSAEGAFAGDEVRVGAASGPIVNGRFEVRSDVGSGAKEVRAQLRRDGRDLGAPAVVPIVLVAALPTYRVEAPSWARVAPVQLEAARRHRVPVAFENDLGMRFVLIPEGTFEMGSRETESGRHDDEVAHAVTLTRPFYLSIHETTTSRYRRLKSDHKAVASPLRGAGETGAERRLDDDEQPVVAVSHDDAVAFAAWLSARESGRRYRLPTESEWERAARGGTTTAWFWGDDATDARKFGNYADAAYRKTVGSKPGADDDHDGFGTTAPVGRFLPNPFGLYDTFGNVLEWCSDWYWDYPAGGATDPVGHPRGSTRVLRGGQWTTGVVRGRSAERFGEHPDHGRPDSGFRLVAEVAAGR